MQTSLILLASALAVTSASIISLVPVSYIASPFPTYNHVQNTRTGEYAYNYAGGPSAKEEIKTLDGVTRGAYSYVDGFGIVQSAQYIADENGFRVAATNVPTDAQVGVNVPVETPEVQAAKAAHFAEHAKAVAALGRKKRSLSYAAVPTAVSSQYHHQKHESVKIETPVYQQYVSAAPLAYASYQHVPVAVATAPSAVSHQSRIQTHNNAHLEVAAPWSYSQVAGLVPDVQVFKSVPDQIISYQEAVEIPAAPVAAVAVASVPTAIASQSRYQVHNSQKIEVQTPVYEQVALPVAPVVPAVPAAPQTDSVVVEAVRTAVPVAAAVSSVPTAVSSQSRTQIHNGHHIELEAPRLYAAQVVDSYGHPTVAHSVATLAAPVAVSSQSRTQVHSGQSLEVAAPVYGPSYLVPQVPLDTPEVAAAKQAHAKAYAAELAKHQGW